MLWKKQNSPPSRMSVSMIICWSTVWSWALWMDTIEWGLNKTSEHYSVRAMTVTRWRMRTVRDCKNNELRRLKLCQQVLIIRYTPSLLEGHSCCWGQENVTNTRSAENIRTEVSTTGIKYLRGHRCNVKIADTYRGVHEYRVVIWGLVATRQCRGHIQGVSRL